jgi:hypothetical protein
MDGIWFMGFSSDIGFVFCLGLFLCAYVEIWRFGDGGKNRWLGVCFFFDFDLGLGHKECTGEGGIGIGNGNEIP